MMNPAQIQRVLKVATGMPVESARRIVAIMASQMQILPTDSEIQIKDPEKEMQDLRKALGSDHAALGNALWETYQAGDYPATQAALKKLRERVPDLIGEAPLLSELLAVKLAEAWVGEDPEEEKALEAKGTRAGAIKGWQTRRSHGRGRAREGEDAGRKTDLHGRIPGAEGEHLSVKDNLARAKKAVEWARRNKKAVAGAVYRRGLGRVDLPYGRAGVKRKDYQQGEGLRHLDAKHPEDTHQLARTLALGKVNVALDKGGKIDATKKMLTHKGYVAFVVKNPTDRHSWTLTHYYNSEK